MAKSDADNVVPEPKPDFPLRYRIGPFGRFLRILGPGLITGAADDDPSGVATYTQAGAQLGYSQLWTLLFMYPMMTAVQEACARIGAVTGKGLASVIKDRYSRPVLVSLVMLMVLANVINIGSDLGAMSEGLRLVIPSIPFWAGTVGFAIFMILTLIFTSYKTYVNVLKWLSLGLLAYFVTALIIGVPWGKAIYSTFVPHIDFSFEYFYILTGLLGTTISPYLFFWQPSEVVEEEIAQHRLPQKGGIPRLSKRFMRNMRIDTAFGMFFSQITAWFIIVTGATVLGAHGIMNVNSAADAAKALEPLVQNFPNAGYIAKMIFASGMIGLGLLAVPVLAGSAAYALSETFGLREGLYNKFSKARGFYAIIIAATLAGLAINFVGIDPIKALVFTAVFNGIAAVPLIFVIAKISRNREVMGEYRSGWLSSSILWITFLVMAGAALLLFASFAIK